jgi:5-(aminomethyl)-3-furanmethanol phosphate kinase
LFVREVEPMLPGTVLEVGWHVTSDSIAARLAICLGDARLRLLKSRPPTAAEAVDWACAARGRLVDAFFPCLANHLRSASCETLPGAIETRCSE